MKIGNQDIRPTGLIVKSSCIACPAPVANWLDHGMTFMAGKGARRRNHQKTEVDLAVWHWTGSENPVTTMFRVLQKRELGVEVAIEWPEDDEAEFAPVVQFADPWLVDTFDAGFVNPRSWGLEIVSSGLATMWRRFRKRGHHRESYVDTINGKKQKMVRFHPAQIRSAIAVTEAINGAMRIPMTVPTNPDGSLIKRTMTRGELARYRGIVGHYHVSPRKIDPGTDLLEWMLAVQNCTK